MLNFGWNGNFDQKFWTKIKFFFQFKEYVDFIFYSFLLNFLTFFEI